MIEAAFAEPDPESPVQVVVADITTLDVDVIVNAANPSLLGGGGVDGAIHRAAGPGLLEECRTLGGAEPGEVKFTGGHRLPARFVAHAVGPVWAGGDREEDACLASCYRGALEETARRGLRSIAFPAISTGAYGFPLSRAAAVATGAVADGLRELEPRPRVVFCCFSAVDARIYED
ncbi:MAG: macro domain-containing protein, partial [Longimicrobiales bacterium]